MQTPTHHDYGRYGRPDLQELLELLRLDVVYDAARGDQLRWRRADGTSVPVVDFVGGYGCNLLGHHHPRLHQVIQLMMNEKTPVFVQGAVKPRAGALAARLNRLVGGSLTGPPEYLVHLCSTGAEAVEAALLHASLVWEEKRAEHLDWIDRALTRTQPGTPAHTRWLSYREEICGLAPRFVALKGSFHGKTAGALKVTANHGFGQWLSERIGGVDFIEPDAGAHQEQLRSAVAAKTAHGLPRVAGVVLELMQCEGGMRLLDPAFVKTLVSEADTAQVPLIVDEIQTGCGRTGDFLLCQRYSLRPTYLLLGKALGGGLAKIAALLIARDAYLDQFGVKRTSTFAEDEWTSGIALAATDIMIEEQHLQRQSAQAFEKQVRTGLASTIASFPEVLREIRGCGLALGVVVDGTLGGRGGRLLRAIEESGYLGYVFASYLLHNWQVRVLPSLSNPDVLRLEPSAYIEPAAVEHLLLGINDLVVKLAAGEALALTAHLWADDDRYRNSPVRSPGRPINTKSPEHSGDGKDEEPTPISFLSHFIDEQHAASFDPALAALRPAERQFFVDRLGPLGASVVYHQQRICGANGREVLLSLHGITCDSRFFERSMRVNDGRALHKVRAAYKVAAASGAAYVGLGQYTSIVSHNGVAIAAAGPPLTTGNSLTVALALAALERLLAARGLKARDVRLGVVGALGNIGSTVAMLAAENFGALTLIHRQGTTVDPRLSTLKTRLYETSTLRPQDILATAEVAALSDCNVIVTATNATVPLLHRGLLPYGAIVLDLSVPSSVDPDLYRERPDISLTAGGYATLPCNQRLNCDLVPTADGEVYGCMAETITLGLLGYSSCYSRGELTVEGVRVMSEMATQVGIGLGAIKRPGRADRSSNERDLSCAR